MKLSCKAGRQRGMTVIEMLVAITIFVIGVQGFTMLFVKAYRANKFTLEEGAASAAIQRSIREIAVNIRRARQADNGAYVVVEANDSSFTFFSDLDEDGDTERVRYFLEGEQLKRGVSEPSGIPVTYPVTDDLVTTVASYIVNESDEPVFYYFNNLYPGDMVNNPLTTPAQPENVTLVKIHLRINIDPSNQPENINFESFAQLRNLRGL